MSSSPNILLLFSDQHRWDWIGCMGRVPVRTPHIDALARRGVRFNQCRVNSPMCGPSRACLATGLRYEQVNVAHNRQTLDPTRPTFMKQLRSVGYQVISLGKTDLHKPTREFGEDGWASVHDTLGFTDACDHAGKRDAAISLINAPADEAYSRYLQQRGLLGIVQQDQVRRAERIKQGRGIPAHPGPIDREHQIDDYTGRLAMERFKRLPTDSPWFMQINWGSPHAPFDAARELVDRYRDVTFPLPIAPGENDRTDHQAVRRQYAAMIEGMDEWIGRVIEAVTQRGELDNTIILYTSDHGEMLGDHGLWNKGYPHEPSIHVPLIVAGPNMARGATCDAPVELIDLAATFCDWTGAPSVEDWPARSLASLAAVPDKAPPPHDITLSAFIKWQVACDGRWKLVRHQVHGERLFDLRQDPHELCDVLPEHPGEARRLEQVLTH